MNFTAPFIIFTAVSLILLFNLKLCIIPCDKNSVKSQYTIGFPSYIMVLIF